MVNITITITESLNNRLKKFPDLNKSELFQSASEKKLKLLEQLSRKETEIPPEIIIKIKEGFEEPSFQFGKDWCIEWIKAGAHYLDITKAAFLAGKEEVFKELYELIGESIEPIEAYEETFSEQEDGGILDRGEFAKGFTLEAKMVVNAVKEMK